MLVAEVTGITFLLTSVLAFAPGGVAEMATTAVVLHADSTFVVTVQDASNSGGHPYITSIFSITKSKGFAKTQVV